MASFDDIPLEVQEQIFLHLTPQDLKECSTVCSKWHEIINSNQIWLKICALEGLAGKKFLDDDFCLLKNPTKQFSNEVTFAPPCHWKSHFNRYKYVKRNWRTGYYVKETIPFSPVHMNEQYVIQHLDTECVIWDVCGKLNKFCSIKLALPSASIDHFFCKGDFIVYSQQRLVVCLKRSKNSCKEVLRIQLEAGSCSQVRSTCMNQQLTVRLSEKFLLVQDHLNPCVLSFYDFNKGKLARKVDLHKALGNMSLYCCSLNVVDEKVFFAYKMSTNSFLAIYHFGLDTWEVPISLPNEVLDLYVSKKFVSAKLSPEGRDTPITILHLWDHSTAMQPIKEVCQFFASRHLPIVLTDDYVIYHIRDEIKMHTFGIIKPLLTVSRSVLKFVPIWNRYLVILDEKGVSVWDRESGEKINTPFRDNYCATFYVSETNIVIRGDDEKFYLISYW